MEAVGCLVRKAKIHPGVAAGGPRQNLSLGIGSLQVGSMMRTVWKGGDAEKAHRREDNWVYHHVLHKPSLCSRQ